MIELSGCEKRKFKSICSSVDKLDKEPWEKVELELINQKGLTKEMTTNLKRFVEYTGEPWELLQKIKDKGLFKGHESGEATIKEMELLFTYCEAMGCLGDIIFDFSLARGLDYYTGLIYEAVLTDENRVGSIAGGGRYDGLVGMFSGKEVPSVGVSIGIERVFAILEEKVKAKAGVRETKTQILVAQASKNLVADRLKILGELWGAGIAAETVYKDNANPKNQLEFALENGIPLVLFIGENELKDGVVQIKELNTETQTEVQRSELIPQVKKFIEKNPVLLSKD